MRVSCKKLSDLLEEVGIIKTPQELRDNCEAFGNNVQCFLFNVGDKERAKIENFLESRGCTVTRDWNKGTNGICVAVTYFKAWHWNV